MRFHKILLSGLTAVAGLGMASQALADGRNPGSLLVYPEFDNRDGVVTLLTVTNTDADGEDVKVEFKYIGRYNWLGFEINCEEFNRTETLTANDTLSLITNFHNPQYEQGYVYVFAKEGVDGIQHDALIGNVMTVDGLLAFEYSVNPFAYNHLGASDGDGLRDLDGVEYEGTPDELYVPRFLGQGGPYKSELILIGLTGGAAFDTTVDFLIYNDNEEVFTSECIFYCWDPVTLLHISVIFDNDFLQLFTNNDPAEMLGVPLIETGWIRMWGAVATSSSLSIQDPSVLGMLVERIGNRGAADLPWESAGAKRTNGKLLARSRDGEF